jgi:P27 family predicted phage terminase small subunit
LKAKIPKPPKHLSAISRSWWSSVAREYNLQPTAYHLLTAACEALDRLNQARELIARDGLLIVGPRGGMRAHPAIAIERDSRIALARLIAALDLEDEPQPPLANMLR